MVYMCGGCCAARKDGGELEQAYRNRLSVVESWFWDEAEQ